MEGPGQRANEESDRDDAEGGNGAERERSPEAVNEVVDRHRSRMELPMRQVTAAAVKQREVGTDPESGDLPIARVRDRLGGDRGQKQRRERGVGDTARCAAALDRSGGHRRSLSACRLTA